MDDCNKLIIPEVNIDWAKLQSDPSGFSEMFDQLGRPASLSNAPWGDSSIDGMVQFRIAWSEQNLLLKFTVREREILGRFTKDRSDVFKDSCVEMFLSPEGKDYYYNFEFNCLGSCLLQKGTQREGREVLSQEILDRIIRIPSLGGNPVHNYHEGISADAPPWTLMLVIPSSVFIYETFDTFSAVKMKGNLYKCGDDLQDPHYLCWNRIDTAAPDFHRPEYFGELWFS